MSSGRRPQLKLSGMEAQTASRTEKAGAAQQAPARPQECPLEHR